MGASTIPRCSLKYGKGPDVIRSIRANDEFKVPRPAGASTRARHGQRIDCANDPDCTSACRLRRLPHRKIAWQDGDGARHALGGPGHAGTTGGLRPLQCGDRPRRRLRRSAQPPPHSMPLPWQPPTLAKIAPSDTSRKGLGFTSVGEEEEHAARGICRATQKGELGRQTARPADKHEHGLVTSVQGGRHVGRPGAPRGFGSPGLAAGIGFRGSQGKRGRGRQNAARGGKEVGC
jgi:hypothetical protein